MGGGDPCLGLPPLVHHDLGEVPLDCVHQEPSLPGLEYERL